MYHVSKIVLNRSHGHKTRGCVFGSRWSQWWSYDGINGPAYWGLVNKEWSVCKYGQHQSPVDINPKFLLYDPNLRPVRTDDHKVDSYIVNNGHDITIYINETGIKPFQFTGGPLSYTYRVHHIKFHFGSGDHIGSEHTVQGRSFPLELQIYGYNNELYDTYRQAEISAHGIAAISLFGTVGDVNNDHLDFLVNEIKKVARKDTSTPFPDLSIVSLIPETPDYMTYEGSLTQPSCWESVTWVVYNKPMHITADQLNLLRQLHKADDADAPPLLMENNFRPPMPVNRRTIRTNIQPRDLVSKSVVNGENTIY
ncbi:carbonic anhydrase-related protein 10 [Elysia marginata]|uniref:Carbonic anhydrase-related protein 10 n=1 Tax=Elysia marginata TaxID=1093978 RepID=A0AAV4ELE8_9GAST|nr:carbonic anhydrase-related protein 10 [Elysia marginata]